MYQLGFIQNLLMHLAGKILLLQPVTFVGITIDLRQSKNFDEVSWTLTSQHLYRTVVPVVETGGRISV